MSISSIDPDEIHQKHANLPQSNQKILIIVESPTKAKKIESYTGIPTIASMGHFKEMPKGEFAIDIEKNYTPKFIISPQKKDLIEKIKKLAENAVVYLASDDDREGFAIAFHFYNLLKKSAISLHRMTYKEVTKNAILSAMAAAIPFKETNMRYFDAFLGRRVGDRLVGYILSPIVAKELHIPKGSAGRVQTPGVRLLVEREREIRAFKALPEKDKLFYEIIATLDKNGVKFELKHKENFQTRDLANVVLAKLAAQKNTQIDSIEKKERKKNPPAPFITITVQSTASSKLGFSPEKTMQLMQDMFEGGAGTEGIITYHRTDSFMLSDEFKQTVKQYLEGKGLVFTNHIYKNKASAQEGHEAIRPVKILTNDELDMTMLKAQFNADHKSLYLLIQNRAIASCCEPAIYDSVTVTAKISDEEFSATGETLKKSGYLSLYANSEEDKETPTKKEVLKFPPLEKGETVLIDTIEAKECKKKTPERYSEASLLTKLEKLGIGRPSTSTTIIKTLKAKYASLEKEFLVPNENAFLLIDYLEKSHFWICDYTFTKQMEEFLDGITQGKCDYLTFMKILHEKMHFLTPSLIQKNAAVAIGPCICGSTFCDYGTYYKCECKRSMPKIFSQHEITAEEASKLFQLNDLKLDNLISKKGTPFSGTMSFVPDDEYTYRASFDIEKSNDGFPTQEVGKCQCSGSLSKAPFGLICNKCKKVVWQKSKLLAKPLSDTQMIKLAQGATISSKNVLDKNGEKHEASFSYAEYAPGKWGISFAK